MMSNDEMIKFINSVLEEVRDPKDVNVFYSRHRAMSENWSLEKYSEVVKYV